MARTRAVLFDADHTLLDTDRAEKAALRAALAGLGLGLSPSTLATYRRINAALWQRYSRGEIEAAALALERFRQLLAHLGEDPRRAVSLSEGYLGRLSERGDLLPGRRRALAWLRPRYALAIVTNGYDRVQRGRLRAARLEAFFDVVVTSESCGFAKPDPRIVGVALEALRLRPGEALYVGDDPHTDGGAARGAGVRFCWLDRGLPVPPDVPRPRRRVKSLDELVEILDGS